MTQTPSFAVSPEDADVIAKIGERAAAMDTQFVGRNPELHHKMNITACHANGNPLRLVELLFADNFNFAHDVFGIDRHLSRETGKLENCFSPRFSARVDA